MDINEARDIFGRAAKIAHELTGDSHISSESHAMAWDFVAETLGRETAELKREVYRTIASQKRGPRNDAPQKPAPTLPPAPMVVPVKPTLKIIMDAPETDRRRKPAAKLYAEWCAENDWVPNDNIVAHFTQVTPNGISKARAQLTRQGYRFMPIGNGSGWLVERNHHHQKELEELRSAIEKAQRRIDELTA